MEKVRHFKCLTCCFVGMVFFLLNRKLFGFPVRMVLRCEKKFVSQQKPYLNSLYIKIARRLISSFRPLSFFWLFCYCSTSLKKILSNKIIMETLRNIHYWVGFVLTQKWERIEVWIFVPELKTFRFVLSLENNFRNRFQRLLRGPNIVGKLLDIKKLNWITIRCPFSPQAKCRTLYTEHFILYQFM